MKLLCFFALFVASAMALPQLDLQTVPAPINGNVLNGHVVYTLNLTSSGVTFVPGDSLVCSIGDQPMWSWPYPVSQYPAMPMLSFYWWPPQITPFRVHCKAVDSAWVDITEPVAKDFVMNPWI